ncbi:uncharacterized protein LOC130387076 [Gadus chalcogrammus]|uniref:uncharacterized protein LOC130387076 n=1 Tax=Gadus chalcogrammus TaxID=1042646 RepID=UPI0024C4C4F3|nr:uncharacterized protein LOC130387076 [Gadus chalcogrammus]XP_056452001.1 uncharacterized protein LOC130387076 [Gadus chalcogrammus]
MAVDSGKTVVLAALGRPFSLGMLYDCRNDSLIPALTLWNREALEKEANEIPQPNSDFEIVASDSIEDKYSALNVEASLQASFLCGLVEIGGSAKYLSDSKISSNQARVTLKYKTTTKFKELSMNHIGRDNVQHPYVFELEQATHVVTGILYGAQAFFVFDREVSQKENRQNIEGYLKVLIKKTANLKIDGHGSLNMADKDIENVDKFSCKFHGDFNLEKTPATFQEAIEVYQSLPKLLGTNGENAVPQKVWLMPLKTLDSTAAQLVRQISDSLIRDAQNILEDLSELVRRCNDAERCKTAQVKKNVRTFKELVLQHKLKLQNNMKRTLPLIRGGGEEEGVLAKILEKVHSSPFQIDKLNEWMDCKGTEMIIMSSLIDKMSKIVIVTSRTTLQQEIHSADITHAVCFVFTSLEAPEPYLSALSKHLDETQTDNVSCAYDVEKEPWFSSDDVMDKVQEKVKVFKDFAEANKENKSIRFLTAEKRDNVKKGATLHLYKDGSLVTDNFEPPSKPGMIIRDITHNSVTLNISPPRSGLTTDTSYTVEFCVHGDDVWHQQMEIVAGDVTVSSLKINEDYQIRCRAKCAVGFGSACEGSAFKTLKKKKSNPTESSVSWEKPSDRLAISIKKLSKELKPGSPSVFKLPLKQNHIRIDGCKSYTFGEDSVRPNRTLMFLGATGSGKSTLINGMINYILGIDWEDSFRFKLIDEDQSKSQAESQTPEVTTYKINHQDGFRVPYSLTLVDTPGFGDTKGIVRDGAITEQIRTLFTSEKGVLEIDAICFVHQASQARLTHTQKYVIDSVLSIFGKDVAENICILVTFSDGQPPPVLAAINAANIPCPKTDIGLPVHHKFNNSALFAENNSFSDIADQGSKSSNNPPPKKMEAKNFDAMFWEMGASSMEKFFAALGQMTTKSLQLTKEVLNERKQLEVAVEGIQAQIRASLAKLEEIRSTKEQIEKHNADISCNENFKFEVEILKPVQIELTKEGEFITNCQQCSMTCHYPCAIADDKEKSGCAAMSGGKCRVCPGNCPWEVHFNQKYKWDYVKEKQKRTIKELKEKYKKATEAKISVEELIEHLEEDVVILQDEIMSMIKKSSHSIARLKEIALRPDPLSTPDYIDLLIQGEKSEGKEGYLARIESLEKIKENAQIMAKVSKGEPLTSTQDQYIKDRKKRKEGKGIRMGGWFKNPF